MTPKVGDKAPDFSTDVAGGGKLRLSDFKGKKAVVLYFYPITEKRYKEILAQIAERDAKKA